MTVDLPTPGAPVSPMILACPLSGASAVATARSSGAAFSTREISRASALGSPALAFPIASRARSAAVDPAPPGWGRVAIGLLAATDVTPQPPGRTPHKAPQAPLRCPGGEDTPPEASEAPAREAM